MGRWIHPLNGRTYAAETVTLPGHLVYEIRALCEPFEMSVSDGLAYLLAERNALECTVCHNMALALHPATRKTRNAK